MQQPRIHGKVEHSPNRLDGEDEDVESPRMCSNDEPSIPLRNALELTVRNRITRWFSQAFLEP